MKLPLFLTSTLTGDTRANTVTNKKWLFCYWKYFYRPNHWREHLGVDTAGVRHVHLYNPFPEHVQCHSQIVKDLKERDGRDKIQDREVTKRSLFLSWSSISFVPNVSIRGLIEVKTIRKSKSSFVLSYGHRHDHFEYYSKETSQSRNSRGYFV